jgi:molybdenum cofactor biosynthesis enzyme MoaA
MADDEATRTVRTKGGKVFDISKDIPTRSGKRRLETEEMMDIFSKVRLRYSLTPQCNIWCGFCSNEGLSYLARREKPANLDLVMKLGDMLIESTPLKSIDLSGGDPTLHPDIYNREFRVVEWMKKHPQIKYSIHTNGIEFTPEVIDQFKEPISRIGISLHSMNFDTWNKITNPDSKYQEKAQREKFEKLMVNIEYLGQQGIGNKVFLKSVIMKGVNDGQGELEELLATTKKFGFHPKLLEFEPQYPGQTDLIVPRAELFATLERIGCSFPEELPRENNPSCYFPNVNFTYQDGDKTGVGIHSIFGCGQEGACLACYDYLCMFVKPSSDGTGLYLKPCSVLDTRIDLTHAINQGNPEHLIELFKMSREYLMTAPGIGAVGWNKEKEFETEAAKVRK